MSESNMRYGQALVASYLRQESLPGRDAESMEERRRALEELIREIRADLGAALTWMRMRPGLVGLSIYCETNEESEEKMLSRHLLDSRRGVYLRFDGEAEYRTAMEHDRHTEQLLQSLAAGADISPEALQQFLDRLEGAPRKES